MMLFFDDDLIFFWLMWVLYGIARRFLLSLLMFWSTPHLTPLIFNWFKICQFQILCLPDFLEKNWKKKWKEHVFVSNESQQNERRYRSASFSVKVTVKKSKNTTFTLDKLDTIAFFEHFEVQITKCSNNIDCCWSGNRFVQNLKVVNYINNHSKFSFPGVWKNLLLFQFNSLFQTQKK